MSAVRSKFSGLRLTGAVAALLSGLFLLELVLFGVGEDGIRAVVRQSAQTSVLLFCAAFAASALRQALPAPLSTWLLRERRYVGLSFAYSHACHLLALLALGQVSQEFVDSLNAVTLGGGGLAYVFLTLMAATSNDRAVRTLGVRNWGRLHSVGGYYIWIIFFQSYAPRAINVSPGYLLPTLLLLVTMGLRLKAWRQAR